MNSIFEDMESEVRSYCRKYPVKFQKARNSELFTADEKRYIDFLSVAGSMNFGHNNPEIKAEILKYLQDDNIINALDMHTEAKEDFLLTFKNKILEPRNLNYKVMCCGPTGTNAVEAALKLARKNTQRKNVIAFAGAFHGMSLGSLAMTSDRDSRAGAVVSLPDVTFVPYDGIMDSIAYLKWLLEDDHSGVEKPAAIFLETLQAEGGINIASVEWMQEVRKICDEYDILMVCDDIQVGIGRTGYFFSFERADIEPDMVVLSKSISGFGMPMALLLMKPEFDIFKPAEHNGTFRGNQLSFVGGTAGLNFFCKNKLDEETQRKSVIVEKYIKNEICVLNKDIRYRGMGLIWGIDFGLINSQLAEAVVHKGFENGIILEMAGRRNGVLKLMPPLTIEDEILIEGLQIVKKSICEVLNL